MRILLVSDEFGRPENTGYRARVANLARGLDALGPVDWVVASRGDTSGLGAPSDVSANLSVHELRPASRVGALRRWLTSSTPWRIANTDATHARISVARMLHQATDAPHGPRELGPYDLVVFTQIDTAEYLWAICEPYFAAGAVVGVDLNDLESAKIAHQLQVESLRFVLRRGGFSVATPKQLIRLFLARVDRPRWARLETRYAQLGLTFVCSELDRERLDDRPVVLANGVAPAPANFVRRPDVAHPTVLFVGSMSYRPNADAAVYAAREVLPRIREHLPHASLRLVGRGSDPAVDALRDLEGVKVVGEVDAVGPELARAHVSLVPIRYGGGTRVKILESFAHGVPVVSTAIGAEGLAVTHDEHCLIADDATSMAEACVRIIAEPTTGRRLAACGLDLVSERYDAATIRAALAQMLRGLVTER